MRLERQGTVWVGILLAGWGIYMVWHSIRENGFVPGIETVAIWVCLLSLMYLYHAHQTRRLHDVYLDNHVLRIAGPRVNATVPLTLVRYVELLPMGRGRRRIILTFDRRAGIGESVEFIPAGVPLFGGGEDVAAELSQLVKNAHAVDMANTQFRDNLDHGIA